MVRLPSQSACAKCWNWCRWKIMQSACPASFPAVSVSASPSPARLRQNRNCCCWMSRWAALDLQLRRQMQLELKQPAKKAGHHLRLHHARSGRGHQHVRPHRRHGVGGRFEQIGTPEEIYDEPKTHYVAQFIGRSTILDGTVESVGRNTAVIRGACGASGWTLPARF